MMVISMCVAVDVSVVEETGTGRRSACSLVSLEQYRCFARVALIWLVTHVVTLQSDIVLTTSQVHTCSQSPVLSCSSSALCHLTGATTLARVPLNKMLQEFEANRNDVDVLQHWTLDVCISEFHHL